jgi:hypothetical protein
MPRPAVTTLATATSATATAISTTATTTAAATAIPATTAAAAGPFFTRPGDVNSEVPPVQTGAIHCIHGLLGFFLGAHGDESESARPAAVAVGHEIGLEDGAVRGESVLQIVFGGVEGEVSDKQFIIHAVILISFLESPAASESVPVSGLESSLNVAHVTIYHRLKVLSYPTIPAPSTFSVRIARICWRWRFGLSLQRNGL